MQQTSRKLASDQQKALKKLSASEKIMNKLRNAKIRWLIAQDHVKEQITTSSKAAALAGLIMFQSSVAPAIGFVRREMKKDTQEIIFHGSKDKVIEMMRDAGVQNPEDLVENVMIKKEVKEPIQLFQEFNFSPTFREISFSNNNYQESMIQELDYSFQKALDDLVKGFEKETKKTLNTNLNDEELKKIISESMNIKKITLDVVIITNTCIFNKTGDSNNNRELYKLRLNAWEKNIRHIFQIMFGIENIELEINISEGADSGEIREHEKVEQLVKTLNNYQFSNEEINILNSRGITDTKINYSELPNKGPGKESEEYKKLNAILTMLSQTNPTLYNDLKESLNEHRSGTAQGTMKVEAELQGHEGTVVPIIPLVSFVWRDDAGTIETEKLKNELRKYNVPRVIGKPHKGHKQQPKRSIPRQKGSGYVHGNLRQ